VQIPFAEDQDMIEALASKRPDSETQPNIFIPSSAFDAANSTK
jgi:hypothetical protein